MCALCILICCTGSIVFLILVIDYHCLMSTHLFQGLCYVSLGFQETVFFSFSDFGVVIYFCYCWLMQWVIRVFIKVH